jgi:ADP-ribose pyrophosphatase YjhB (NUDIX family)
MYQDGTNVIVLDPAKRILVVQHNYNGKRWGLPGGEIEPDEDSMGAAERETLEETELTIQRKETELLARCKQRRGTTVSLYRTSCFEGTLVEKPTNEILRAQFMSFEEIICQKEEFGTGYLRMIIMHMRCLYGFTNPVIETLLYEPIEVDAESLGVLVRI